MTYIPKDLRRKVAARANGRCEYCLSPQKIVLFMEIDHITPVSKGGDTTEDNLCLACISCNARKLNFQTGIDPETNTEHPLYNPREQKWSEHFQWDESDTELIGLTEIGRATVARLKMNDPRIVAARAEWVAVGWHPPAQDV